MKQVTVTAISVKDAVKSALKQLNTTEENVEVNVIDEGRKGFLGIGSRLAIVKVSLKSDNAIDKVENFLESSKETEVQETLTEDRMEDSKEIIVDSEKQLQAIKETEKFIIDVAEKMGVAITISSTLEGKYATLQMSGEKIALLIGKRGQTLNSLQYLAQLVTNRHTEQYINILLDAEDYRKRRNETLVQLAHKMASKALYTKKEVSLEPMPSYERKVIHAALMDKEGVKTFSSGTEPYRHIVIYPENK